jgi:hypothetical protein
MMGLQAGSLDESLAPGISAERRRFWANADRTAASAAEAITADVESPGRHLAVTEMEAPLRTVTEENYDRRGR